MPLADRQESELARQRPDKLPGKDVFHPPSAGAKRLLVAIPALNEAKTVGRVIRRIPRDIPRVSEVVVVVIDDGSTDGTGGVARRCGAKVVRHESPMGVGMVFRRALALVVEEAADVLVFLDGDGQFNSRDIRKLVRPILAGEADFVTGVRFGPGAGRQRMGWGRRVGNVGMAWLMSFFTRQPILDAACGFRAYSAETAMRLSLTGKFTYTQETLLNISFKHLRLAQVPIRVRGTRRHGRSRVARNLLAYGYRAMFIILRAYRDYQPLRFFGMFSAVLILLGTMPSGFLLWHFARTGRFSPHLWAGFTGAFLIAAGGMVIFLGILADMLDRIRMYQEALLYDQRRRRWEARRRELSGDEAQASTSDETEV